MYEEKKAFPIKWVIIGGAVLSVLIFFVVYNNIQKNKKEAAYKNLIAEIKKAGQKYGEDNVESVKEMVDECVTLETLIMEKYLESSTKKEAAIIDPRNGQKLTGEVKVSYDDEIDIIAEYLYDIKCEANYDKKVKFVVKEVSTNGFVVELEAPKGIRLNSFQYKLDSEKEFNHDAPTYKFSNLKTGEYKIKVKAVDYLDNTYERETKAELKLLEKPSLEYNEDTATVTINCPETDFEDVACVYTVDSETWIKVTEEKNKYTFKEDGKLIAKVSDGLNNTEPVEQEVIVKPSCIDTTWSTCIGCATGKGSQISNCGNKRECDSCQATKTYNVTVAAKNGTPATQTEVVNSGYKRLFIVTPAKGYNFQSVVCSAGTATYYASSNELLVNEFDEDRTCTVNFVAQSVKPPVKPPVKVTYTVKYLGFDGKEISSKTVESGKKAPSVTPPFISGYDFINWTHNGVTYNFNTPVTANITLNAYYAADRIVVKYNSAGGSSVPSQYIVSGQTATTPTAPKKMGYHFDRWYLNSTPYNFNTPITAPITLTASWIPLISKTVEFDGSQNSRTVTLHSYKGTDSVTHTCKNPISTEMKGINVTIKLSVAEVCKVNILYY